MSEESPAFLSSPRIVDLTTGVWPQVVERFLLEMPLEDRQAFGAGPALVAEFASGRLGRFSGILDPGKAALVGIVGGWVLDAEAEIHLLYIRKEDRRRGFGRRLLSSYLSDLDRGGVTASYLEVRESNRPARFLYYSLGFTLEGVRKGYYQNPKEDGVVMVRRSSSGSSADAVTLDEGARSDG